MLTRIKYAWFIKTYYDLKQPNNHVKNSQMTCLDISLKRKHMTNKQKLSVQYC